MGARAWEESSISLLFQGACWCLSHCAEGQLFTTVKTLRSFEQEIAQGEGPMCCPASQVCNQGSQSLNQSKTCQCDPMHVPAGCPTYWEAIP